MTVSLWNWQQSTGVLVWIVSFVLFLRQIETASNSNRGPHFRDRQSPFPSDCDRYGRSYSAGMSWRRAPEYCGGGTADSHLDDEFASGRRRRLESYGNSPGRPPWISSKPNHLHSNSYRDRRRRGARELSASDGTSAYARYGVESPRRSEFRTAGRSGALYAQETSEYHHINAAYGGKREREHGNYRQQQRQDADRRRATGTGDRWRGDRRWRERGEEHSDAAEWQRDRRTRLWEASPPPPEEPLWDRILNGTFDSFWSCDRSGVAPCVQTAAPDTADVRDVPGQALAEHGERSAMKGQRSLERGKWREQRKQCVL